MGGIHSRQPGPALLRQVVRKLTRSLISTFFNMGPKGGIPPPPLIICCRILCGSRLKATVPRSGARSPPTPRMLWHCSHPEVSNRYPPWRRESGCEACTMINLAGDARTEAITKTSNPYPALVFLDRESRCSTLRRLTGWLADIVLLIRCRCIPRSPDYSIIPS